MSKKDKNAQLATLKDFQKRTVDYALHRLYDAEDSTGRFLVADEVGMGKTLVARGVIAGAIERLQNDNSVDRIDILYICSNSAIARQNLSKLRISDNESASLDTRITMLAENTHNFNRRVQGEKTINLISFTPGTSFDQGTSRGMVRERALMYSMLTPLFEDRAGRELTALGRLLRHPVQDSTWKYHLDRIDPDKIDAGIAENFRWEIRESELLSNLEDVIGAMAGHRVTPQHLQKQSARVVRALRAALAKASVDSLEPDLVILDEFQRFKHLLEAPDDDSAAGDVRTLAQQLFGYKGVRVLLLSATPYKLLTMAGEEEVTGDDHYKDFLATARFLVGDREDELGKIENSFREFRRALVSGSGLEEKRLLAQMQLTRIMTRTERPTIGESKMGEDIASDTGAPTRDELVGYVAMDRLAQQLGVPLPIDYWKSAPYFLNFMDGYQIGREFREQIKERGAAMVPPQAKVIRKKQVAERQEIEPNNARLRRLQEEIIGSEMWKLLWLPPSLPYMQSAGAYKDFDAVKTTKRLIFSSWAAAPNSIAALLSHEAARNIFSNVDARVDPYELTPRFEFKMSGGLASGMTTLALFTPVPELALSTDPLAFLRNSGSSPLSPSEAIELATAAVRAALPKTTSRPSNLTQESWYWAAPFVLWRDRKTLSALTYLSEMDDEADAQTARTRHVKRAVNVQVEDLGRPPADAAQWVATLGIAGPGNVAFRALRRTTQGLNPSMEMLTRAAAIIGEGFRSLFNRPESMALIDQLKPDRKQPYWQRVLSYCIDGNLQSVMDEYLHHQVGNRTLNNENDLIELATEIRDALSIRTSAVNLFNPRAPSQRLHINTRFAVRYGSARGKAKSDEQSENRLTTVQNAFNSPFWPMVLASTSVGQEGVDFHWWCHSLVHWNLPSNPVDIEQREGRVHRFKGHAVRKNVAAAFQGDALKSDVPDPWSAMFDTAYAARPDSEAARLGDLWPWWVFPGEAKIQTWSPTLPFSRDVEREARLKRLREIYRLAFGQPRQQELLELLAGGATNLEPLDLRPPQIV